jgi:hypothetical protein
MIIVRVTNNMEHIYQQRKKETGMTKTYANFSKDSIVGLSCLKSIFNDCLEIPNF